MLNNIQNKPLKAFSVKNVNNFGQPQNNTAN